MNADWLSVAEARDRVLADAAALGTERRPLLDAHGCVLAEAVHAPLDVPSWDNSAMDGYAVRAADVLGAAANAPRVLRLLEDVPAGRMPARPLEPGAATRVMTGAPVPAGTDGVVRVEHTEPATLPDGTPAVRIASDADARRNVRMRGEELRAGARVLEPGAELHAARLALAASLGAATLQVVRRPRVAVLASGDELVELDRFDEVLAGRRIVSSNSYALAAQLREAGVEVVPLGIAGDTRASLHEHLERARGCDALVTSGGVSMGEHDLIRVVLQELGLDAAFWRVRMRPGSPFGYGRVRGLGGICWFGLPGNPVSSMVTFEVFVRPALLRMAGHGALFHPTVAVELRDHYPGQPGLTHFARATLHGAPGEHPTARLTGPQGSGMLSSMALADALLVVPPEPGRAAAGDVFTALRLRGRPLQVEPGF